MCGAFPKKPHGRFTLENSENSQVSDQKTGANRGHQSGTIAKRSRMKKSDYTTQNLAKGQ